MAKPIDIFELLRRGGDMTDAEAVQLTREMTEAKLSTFQNSIQSRTYDQPIKVMPLTDNPPHLVGGYFSQQKFILGKTPEEMGRVLGTFGKFANGALVMEFVAPLQPGDFQNRAYTYLPDGKPYVANPAEKVYLPGSGAPQWELTKKVEARCIATVKPGQVYTRKSGGKA